ncbi:ATP cone domain-containing protein [Maribacter chungangensis]|uniref:ATP cone domain-containing protein n=1 Tax=Maribacter chungangensis TaxID=1069117 RepID=A0ABW3B2J8_9FLAO
MNQDIEIIKSSGEKAKFSLDKLRNSLKHSGASHNLVEEIVARVRDELYQGISTREIYNRAYALLKKEKNSVFASKYKLKKAIYELGPTGFPFERFVSALLEYSGFSTKVGVVMDGICVTHEIDVVAEKKGRTTIIECKFHGEEGRNCNVKVPLYINSRYTDVKTHWDTKKHETNSLELGWVVTNTRFTKDAIRYGKCVGLYLLSWDYPKNNGLKDRIDRLGLYPITVSTLLSNREKNFLLSRDVVLCRQLLKDKFYLDHLGVSTLRKAKILDEIKQLCNQ